MKIAIVNDIHIGRPLERDGKVRASSHLIEDSLMDFLKSIQKQHNPDILINLGDLIRSESREFDLPTYRRGIGIFGQVDLPVIHLLGNHELKTISLSEIEGVWRECGFDQKSYGCREVGNFHLVWLGLELNPSDHRLCRLPFEQLEWLKAQLSQNKRSTIIFTHCAIDDHEVNGNFFYEACDNKSKRALFLENAESIREAISASDCVVAVLQAHLHYFHSKQIDGIPYITCPAMGDNICGANMKDNIPNVYTLLTFDQNRLTAKTYSETYCFAGFEL